MGLVLNLALVVAGSFLAGFASLLLDALPWRRRLALAAASAAGLLVLLSRAPFREEAVVAGGTSALYALAASGLVLATLLEGRRDVPRRRIGQVAASTTAGVAVVLAGLLRATGAA